MKKSTITTVVVHSIPQDLIYEILLKLPAKSVLRFRSVSKSWRSIIISQQFIDSFMALSLSRPRLLLILTQFNPDRVLLFSSPHQICSLLSSSTIWVAEKNMPKVTSSIISICNSVRGFACFRLFGGFAVCNPTTGQFIDLANDDCNTCCYLGYDPNSNQYKVLRIMPPHESFGNEHSVLTLGGQGSSHSWRPIKANIPDYEFYLNNCVCIDGVVYYLCRNNHQNHFALGCFDVGSEQLHLIELPENLAGKLTNYLGKLAVYYYNYYDSEKGFILWILDDLENQVWSKKTGPFPSFSCSMSMDFRFEGITAFGEIVYVTSGWTSGWTAGDSVKLFCYDIEKKTERRVEIEGLSESCRIYPQLLCSYADNIIYL